MDGEECAVHGAPNGRRRSLAVLVHELRGQLSAIRLWEYLARKSGDPERRAQALAAIRRCTEDQAELIDELVRSRRSVRRPALLGE